ncbi:MAG: hypothetical protein MJK13_18180 [Pseudomonadales bacterium]|nr:hypothetical protein [Pseudomonadales bacterium]
MEKFKFKIPKKLSLIIWSGILVAFVLLASNIDFMIKLKGGGDKAYITSGNTVNPYQINIYYFSSRKNSAFALTDYFEQQGYLVKTLTASELENSEATRYSPTHFFFNREDFAQAMRIKSDMEQVLGYPISAYRFGISQSVPSMIVVFTHAEKEGAATPGKLRLKTSND